MEPELLSRRSSKVGGGGGGAGVLQHTRPSSQPCNRSPDSKWDFVRLCAPSPSSSLSLYFLTTLPHHPSSTPHAQKSSCSSPCKMQIPSAALTLIAVSPSAGCALPPSTCTPGSMHQFTVTFSKCYAFIFDCKPLICFFFFLYGLIYRHCDGIYKVFFCGDY